MPSGNQLWGISMSRVDGGTDTDRVQLDLLLGVLDGVRAVADVAADSESKVTADSAYDRHVQLAESG
jgi:hypothetical protein